MDYTDFIATVEREAGVPREVAERAAVATLETLGERISGGEADDLAKQLPPVLRPFIHDGDKAQPFDAQEFLRRVSQREGVPLPEAERHARAVFAALGRAVSRDEIEDMAAQLPADFAELVRAALEAPAASDDDDGGARRRAFDAVLETLAERISRGEVEDLKRELAPEFHPALDRGDELSSGTARKLDLQEFVRRIAEREGVTPDEALEHAREVFAWLRETVSEKEFGDITAQLPDDYTVVLARP